MAITILSIFSNRPDFIEPQYDSLKKHLKDEFYYVVVNNSYFQKDRPEEIEDQAKKLNTGYCRIAHGDGKVYVSAIVRDTLNFLWKEFKHTKGILALTDGDVFLINDVSFEELLGDSDMAFCPLETAGKIWPWTGFMLFNMDKLKVDDVNFNFAVLNGKEYADVGSGLGYYIETHKPKIKFLKRHEILNESDERLKDFPLPYSVDFIEDFGFHYKTSSNYAPHCTQEYNELKTKAMRKLL